jgi:hypothetical protein
MTHLKTVKRFHPLVEACGADFDSYLNTTVDCWSRPKADDELVLRQILKAADQWIYQAARRHVEMVPGNLRAKLQVFDGETRIFYLLACSIRFSLSKGNT